MPAGVLDHPVLLREPYNAGSCVRKELMFPACAGVGEARRGHHCTFKRQEQILDWSVVTLSR